MKASWTFPSAIVSALLIVPAMAADLPTKAPILKAPPPLVYNWTGCYLGGGGGYGMLDQEHDTRTLTGVLTDPTMDTGGRGWFGTVQGGCDLQFNSFLPIFGGSMIIGAFADGDWGNINGNNEPAGIGINGTEKLSRSWAFGGRLGWLPTDRFLTFVSVGYTNARVDDINYVVNLTSGPVVAQLPGHNMDGWFIGTGYEYNLGWLPGLTWKTEYRYADYGSRTDTIFGVPSGLPSFTSNSHLFVQTVRSELVWRFNWGGGSVMSRY